MGVDYRLVHRWDTGKHTMSLAHFVRAAALVRLSMDQLAHGHAANAPTPQPELPLSDDAVRNLLFEIRATQAAMTALAEHRASPRGMFEAFTRTYVTSFVSAYDAAIDARKKHAAALKVALVEADNARARLAAVDGKRRPLQHKGDQPQPLAANDGTGTGTVRKVRKSIARIPVGPPTTKH